MSAELLCLSMFAATCAALLAGFPVAFTLAGSGLLFAGLGSLLGLTDFGLISAFPQRIFSVMSSEVLLAVPLFVFMGLMLERSRIAEDLLSAMGALFGRLPGGLGHSVFIVGALLAASTGIAGAAVVTMGLIALPVMLRAGYNPALASGAVAAAGTLGQIVPPSIVLILLGDQLSAAYQQAQFAEGVFNPKSVTVNELFAGALIPGLLLVALYLAFIFALARLKPGLAPPAPKVPAQGPPLLTVLVAPVLLILAVLGAILGGLASASEAAGLGALGALLLAARRLDASRGAGIAIAGLLALIVISALFDLRAGRQTIPPLDLAAILAAGLLSLLAVLGIVQALRGLYRARTRDGQSVLLEVMRGTTRVSSMIFMILLGAALFSLTFRALGGDKMAASALQDLPGGAVSAILLVMLAVFLLGFFLDILEIIFIVVPVVGPVLLAMEIAPGVPVSPVWLGVLIALNLQTAFLTPPFGFALFYLRGVAPASLKTSALYKGVAPFVAIQLLALLVLAFAPGLATWLPRQLFG